MGKTAKEFVANDLSEFVAVLTFGAIVVLGSLGLETASGLTVAVGWFVLTPVFHRWGDDIAEFLYGEDNSREQSQETDALTELKQRYARGEIDDAEFERRLERLIELDEVPAERRGKTERSPRTSSDLESEMSDSTDITESPDASESGEKTARSRDRES